jgi:hypothetical protein
MSLRRGWEIRESVPCWVCLLLGGVTGLMAFVVVPYVLEAVVMEVWDPNYVARLGVLVGSETTAIGLLLLIDAIVAYGLGRLVFTRLRWRVVWTATPFCDGCDYALTGNVSGICPECGRKADDQAVPKR